MELLLYGGAWFLHAPADILLQKYLQAPIESEDGGGGQFWTAHFGEEERVAVERDLNTIPQTFSTFLHITPTACGGSSYRVRKR